MAWSSLASRLARLPLILAGPILRRCEPTEVSVWVATRFPRVITLKVDSTAGGSRVTGTRSTVQLGEHLHVAVVTARVPGGAPALERNRLWYYDLEFAGEEGPRGGLLAEGVLNPRSEPNRDNLGLVSKPGLPSFALAPDSIGDLRIFHGSCRKPHGEGVDAIAALESAATANAGDYSKRPHMLFLTGDQIYADDVADALLFMIMDASDALGIPHNLAPSWSARVLRPPGLRATIVEDLWRAAEGQYGAGFSATYENKPTKAKSHLFGFCEYAAMYLFSWSNVLWPSDHHDLPALSDIWPEQLPDYLHGITQDYFIEFTRLRRFSEFLPRCRRALANIPTYCIFDDHDVTDDWYIDFGWCERVLNSELGRRGIENGLLAYALFQGWGNDPAEFDTSGRPGRGLIDAVVNWGREGLAESETGRADIQERLGVPQWSEVYRPDSSSSPTLPHSATAVHWDYHLTGPGFEVFVLDTRTRRYFPGNYETSRREPFYTGLMTDSEIDRQLPERSDDVHVTIVVTAAPLVLTKITEAAKRAVTTQEGRWDRDNEDWGFNPWCFETFLGRLVSRRPQPTESDVSIVVVLGGDVHHGYTHKLQFEGLPFGHVSAGVMRAIIVPCVASGFKNEDGNTRNLHGGTPVATLINFMISTGQERNVNFLGQASGAGTNLAQNIQLRTTLRLGWLTPSSTSLPNGGPLTMLGSAGRYDLSNVVLPNQPVVSAPRQVGGGGSPMLPSWRYRIDLLEARRSGPSPAVPPMPSPADRAAAIDWLRQTTAEQRLYLANVTDGSIIVGHNNVGEVRFPDWPANKSRIWHSLWWSPARSRHRPPPDPLPLSTYDVAIAWQIGGRNPLPFVKRDGTLDVDRSTL